jgi:hypothetical membrane protein
MTTLGGTQDRDRTLQRPIRRRSLARQVLLTCGILSSMLYVATDAVGAMRYPGYSFASQTISELAAIGAPTKALVDPLFIAYGVLALAFGVGMFREANAGHRALRMTAVLLIAYATIGFTGFTMFPMHQRGVGSVASDFPHMVLTGVLVLLLLLTMGFGATALGRRFRVYSAATLLTVIVFGALTVPYPARMEAGQPTPGFGIIERILVYSFLMWVAVLAVALLRRRTAASLSAS